MKNQFSRASEKIRSHFFSRFFEIETLVNDCNQNQHILPAAKTLSSPQKLAKAFPLACTTSYDLQRTSTGSVATSHQLSKARYPQLSRIRNPDIGLLIFQASLFDEPQKLIRVQAIDNDNNDTI